MGEIMFWMLVGWAFGCIFLLLGLATIFIIATAFKMVRR